MVDLVALAFLRVLNFLEPAVFPEVRVLEALDGRAKIGVIGSVGLGGDDVPSQAADFLGECLGHFRAVGVPGREDTEALPSQRAGCVGGQVPDEGAVVDGGTEQVASELLYVRHGRRRRDEDHLVRVRGWRDGLHFAAQQRADHGDWLVVLQQIVELACQQLRVAFRVLRHEADRQGRGRLRGDLEGDAGAVQHVGAVGAELSRERKQGADAVSFAAQLLPLRGERGDDACGLLVLGELSQELPRIAADFVVLAGGFMQFNQAQERRVGRERLAVPVRDAPEVLLGDRGFEEIAHARFDLFALLLRGQPGGLDGRLHRAHMVLLFEIGRLNLLVNRQQHGMVRGLGPGLQKQGQCRVGLSGLQQRRREGESRLRRQLRLRVFLQEAPEIRAGLVRFFQLGEDLPQQPVGFWHLRALGRVGDQLHEGFDCRLKLVGILQLFGGLHLALGLLLDLR